MYLLNYLKHTCLDKNAVLTPSKIFVAHMLECITSATPFIVFKTRPPSNFNKII